MLLDEPEYRRRLEAATNTLESGRGDMERGDHNWACFKAQQAAEPAVKSLLHGLGRPTYGHSVARLLDIDSTCRPGTRTPGARDRPTTTTLGEMRAKL